MPAKLFKTLCSSTLIGTIGSCNDSQTIFSRNQQNTSNTTENKVKIKPQLSSHYFTPQVGSTNCKSEKNVEKKTNKFKFYDELILIIKKCIQTK